MDPTTPQTPINIDSMLGSLSDKTQSPSTLNIDNLAKGPITSDYPAPKPPIDDKKPSSSIYLFLKKIGALLISLLILFGIYLFISVQYPIESKAFISRIQGFAHDTITSIQKNRLPDTNFLSGSIMDDVPVEDIYSDQVTPLSDAITQNQSPDTQSSSPFDDIEGQISGDSDTSISSEASADTDSTPQEISSEGLQNTLIALKEQADLYILEHDSANTLHLSIARAISKKSDALLQDFANSQVNLDTISTEITQLEALRARLQ